MNIKLIDGQFQNQDALDIISSMIGIKIRFHEGKIQHSSSEEDIKMRENKIKFLQNELHQLRNTMSPVSSSTTVEAVVNIIT